MVDINSEIRNLIDSCPIPTEIKDKNSKYLYVNQPYADIVNMRKASKLKFRHTHHANLWLMIKKILNAWVNDRIQKENILCLK